MIKLLIVDDSAVVRAMLSELFKNDERFEVSGLAENGERAVELNEKFSPDLIIMDVNMPVMNGIDATKKILSVSNPAVVMFTTEDTVARAFKDGLKAGALEVIKKPDLAVMTTRMLTDFLENIFLIGEKQKKNREESEKKQKEKDKKVVQNTAVFTSPKVYRLLTIGASTGGPAAIQKLLSGLGKDFPLPVLITQHIDSVFDTHFVSWLNETSPLTTELAKNSTIPEKGHVYGAPAGFHLTVTPVNDSIQKCRIVLNTEPPVHFLRPAVDKLFSSAAQTFGKKVISVLLTGMGRDGTEGSRELFEKDALTIAEDESSCVVYGMPKAAVDCGCIKQVLPLDSIADYLRNVTGV